MALKSFLLVVLLVAPSLAQDIGTISCVYAESAAFGYTCNIAFNNLEEGRDDFTEIAGVHLEGRSNADVTYVTRLSGISTIVPRVICDVFPNTERLSISSLGLQTITNDPFSGCTGITWLRLFSNFITEIAENTFANNPLLTYLDLDRNLLTSVPTNLFSALVNLEILELRNNPFTTIPSGLFQSLTSLQTLYLENTGLSSIDGLWFETLTSLTSLWLQYNNLTTIEANSFAGLSGLIILDLQGNQISQFESGAFASLSNLTTLYLNRNLLTWLSHDAFTGLPNLQNLFMNFNQLVDLTEELFWPIDSLAVLGLWGNQIKTIRRDFFGNMNSLRYVDLDSNIINAVEQQFIDDAVALETLYFFSNLCFSGSFFNFNLNRTANTQRLQRCFRNFEFSIETVTEGNSEYNFYRFPQPGIFFRVDAPREVHVSLNPFDFESSPRIEVHLGVANNTRSLIRINGNEDVVDVSTPNLLNDAGWSGFRIVFANWMVLVWRETDDFPFMAFNMQQFYPINFYGLRTPGYVAPWSIQPIDAA